jgi:Domain of unknown function (DUF4864)
MMSKLFAIAVSIIMFVGLASAQSGDDATAIQNSIANQLQAFQTQNDGAAYSYAAPNVTTIFPTVDGFIAMVKRGYDPIYNNTKFRFGKLGIDSLARPAQRVLITTASGKTYEAIYAMEKQADGSWKIAGVQLQEVPGVGV